MKNNRAPTVKELVRATGQTEYDILKVLSMQQYPSMLFSPMGSIRWGQDSGRDRTYEDMVQSQFKEPQDVSCSRDERRGLESIMANTLSEVERGVLRLRLGLDDGEAKAVKEVGRRFQISWKKVRNVEKEAFKKLLNSDEIDDFASSITR